MFEFQSLLDIPVRRTKRVPQQFTGSELAAISLLDSAVNYQLDRIDLQRLEQSVNHPIAIKGMYGSHMSPQEIIQWAQNLWNEDEGVEPEEQYLWAIRGKTNHPVPEDRGEIVGFVTAYTLSKGTISRMKKNGTLESAIHIAHSDASLTKNPPFTK